MRILSIDGGGMLGVVPALLLETVEEALPGHAAEHVDLVAGTSTGGLLAAGLAARVAAADLARLYERDGPAIFHASFLHALRTGWGLCGPDYPAAGLRQALHDAFGAARLSHVPQRPGLLIPAYDIEKRQAVFFKSWKARIHPDRDFLLRDVCLATASAPTYFPPARIVDGAGQEHVYVDGGLQANNPGLCALVEALKAGLRKESVTLISLGCGDAAKPYHYARARHWGKLHWIKPLIDCFMDGPSDVTDHYCTQILGERYVRVQWKQPPDLAMDDAGTEALERLRGIAFDLVAAHGDQLVRLLSS